MFQGSALDHQRPRSAAGIRRLGWLILFGASLAGLGIAISMLSEGMRAVMDIGGSCGSDPSIDYYQACPDGAAGSIMLGVFGGLLAAGVSFLAAWRARVPQLGILAWPALFGILGWIFLEYGSRTSVSPDGFVSSPDSGLIICGLVFEAMAIIPVLVVLYFATVGRKHVIRVRSVASIAPEPVSFIKY